MPKYNISFMYESDIEADSKLSAMNLVFDDLHNMVHVDQCMMEVTDGESEQEENGND